MEILIGLVIVCVAGWWLFFRNNEQDAAPTPYKVDTPPAPVVETKVEDKTAVSQETPVDIQNEQRYDAAPTVVTAEVTIAPMPVGIEAVVAAPVAKEPRKPRAPKVEAPVAKPAAKKAAPKKVAAIKAKPATTKSKKI